jgi:hypothetical protein
MSLTLELVRTPTDEARGLIESLEAELAGNYDAEQRHGYSVERVFQPNILFFIARLDDHAAGCGAMEIIPHALRDIVRSLHVPLDERSEVNIVNT